MNAVLPIVPVILCGGSGTRLWPLSRKLYPKPFVSMRNGNTLFSETVKRIGDLANATAPLVLSNEDYRFYILETLENLGITGDIILEPAARNTAPALALAALAITADGSDGLMLALPSDHFFENEAAFRQTVAQAAPVAEAGYIVTFGIQPTRPEPGYGYLQQGEALQEGGYRVARFMEKPTRELAASLLETGGYFWNSGIFFTLASVFLAELEKFSPQIYAACKNAWMRKSSESRFVRPDPEAFLLSPEDSIDYAIMEKTDRAAMFPMSCGWNDMGSWDAFFQAGTPDSSGNVCVGDVRLVDVENSYIHAQNRLIAAVGLKDMAIVESGDAVLVLPRNRSQDVKKIVQSLKQENRDEFRLHPVVYRPWGSYERLAAGARFQVKRIIVKPGRALSLQMHHHRSEHWIIVRGTAEITIGDQKTLYTENQSAYIPLGHLHKLYNPGKIPLELIEVQSGAYLGEDDIVRLEDSYGRK